MGLWISNTQDQLEMAGRGRQYPCPFLSRDLFADCESVGWNPLTGWAVGRLP